MRDGGQGLRDKARSRLILLRDALAQDNKITFFPIVPALLLSLSHAFRKMKPLLVLCQLPNSPILCLMSLPISKSLKIL